VTVHFAVSHGPGARLEYHVQERGLNPNSNPRQGDLGMSARHFEGRVRVRDRVRVMAISSTAPFGMGIIALRNGRPESVWVSEVHQMLKL